MKDTHTYARARLFMWNIQPDMKRYRKIPLLCHITTFLYQEHCTHDTDFYFVNINSGRNGWRRLMAKGSICSKTELLSGLISIKIQVSLSTWYLAGTQVPRRHSWVWKHGVSKSGSPAGWWNCNNRLPTASEVLSPHPLLLSRRKKTINDGKLELKFNLF